MNNPSLIGLAVLVGFVILILIGKLLAHLFAFVMIAIVIAILGYALYKMNAKFTS
jgi:hypothetical protein